MGLPQVFKFLSLASLCAASVDNETSISATNSSSRYTTVGCSEEQILKQRFWYGRRVDEGLQDHVLGHFTNCSDPTYAAKYCLIGPEQVHSGFIKNDVAVVLVKEEFKICTAFYRREKSSEYEITFTDADSQVSINSFEKDGSNFTFSYARPFFAFLEEHAKVVLSAIYKVDECLRDTSAYPFIQGSKGVFGLRKSAVDKGALVQPITNTSYCTLTQVQHSYETYATEVGETQQHNVLASLSFCEKKNTGYCVFGINETVGSVLEGKVSAIVVSGKSAIMTNEYVSSQSGELLHRHFEYYERFAQGDIIIDGTLYYFSRCLPLLRFISERGLNRTAIVRVSKCMRDFDDSAFLTKHAGIAGILWTPNHRLAATKCPAPVKLIPCSSDGSLHDNSTTSTAQSATFISSVNLALLIIIILLVCVIIAEFVLLIKIIRKSTEVDLYPLD